MPSVRGRITARNCLIHAMWLVCLVLCGFAPPAPGQAVGPEPIRVESNEVLVPALVLDKQRAARYEEILHTNFTLDDAVAKRTRAWEDMAVRDLTAEQFHVLEDGQELRIEKVTPEPQIDPPLVRDSLGQYVEYVGFGGGKWVVPISIQPASPSTMNVVYPPLPGYLIAYAPLASLDGSCHQIEVKVDRPDSLVRARTEYCNTRHIAGDPLKGTKLGQKLASALSSGTKSQIELRSATFAPLSDTGSAGIQINVEFQLEPLAFRGSIAGCTIPTQTVSILGEVYSKNGTLAAQFSDIASWHAEDLTVGPWSETSGYGWPVCTFYEPNLYETRLPLAPGQYVMQLAFSDGKKLGRTEVPLTVDNYDGKQLSISSIVLARRFREMPGGSQDSATTLPNSYVPLVSRGVESTPTADTRFEKRDPLNFYFEVYEPQQAESPARTVEAHLRIVEAKTGIVVENLQPVDATPYSRPGEPVIPIGGGINIRNLPSGSYRLEAQATDSAGNRTPWRATNFTIEQ